MNLTGFLCLCLVGVFGAETDEEEQLSVMKGHNLTLRNIFKMNRFAWYYGLEDEVLYPFRDNHLSYQDNNDNGLLANNKTGDLSIRNIRTEHSGKYTLQVIGNDNTVSWKYYYVTVFAHLPDPVITTNCSQNSSNPQCVLLCSVKSGSHGQTLSLYKNHTLVSNMSLSDPNSGFNLHLKMDCQDENNYSCVVSNSSTNKTTQFNSTDLCQYSEENTYKNIWIVLGVVLGVVVLVAVLVWAVYCLHKKCRRAEREGHSPGDIELKVVSEEDRALHNNGTQNGTQRREKLPETNKPLMNEKTNNSIHV